VAAVAPLDAHYPHPTLAAQQVEAAAPLVPLEAVASTAAVPARPTNPVGRHLEALYQAQC